MIRTTLLQKLLLAPICLTEYPFSAFMRLRDTYPIGFSEASSIWCESTAPTLYGDALHDNSVAWIISSLSVCNSSFSCCAFCHYMPCLRFAVDKIEPTQSIDQASRAEADDSGSATFFGLGFCLIALTLCTGDRP